MTIVVVGIGTDGWPRLPESSRTEITGCDVLLGGRRQLDLVPTVSTPCAPLSAYRARAALSRTRERREATVRGAT